MEKKGQMKYIIVCKIFDQIFQNQVEEISKETFQLFVREHSCIWAIVIEKESGSIKFQFQKETFLIFPK